MSKPVYYPYVNPFVHIAPDVEAPGWGRQGYYSAPYLAVQNRPDYRLPVRVQGQNRNAAQPRSQVYYQGYGDLALVNTTTGGLFYALGYACLAVAALSIYGG